jgi:hypothetical protein
MLSATSKDTGQDYPTGHGPTELGETIQLLFYEAIPKAESWDWFSLHGYPGKDSPVENFWIGSWIGRQSVWLLA